MEEKESDPEVARSRLLELLEGDDWKISDRARREGKISLRWVHEREPTDVEMVDHIISLLKTETTLRCAPQGDPPGSTGIAWQMTDSKNIFIKLQICEIRFGQEFAYIQSIHESVHRSKREEQA